MLPDSLHARIGHQFRRPQLLLQALTHRSHGATHNERLEFIGDAVLDCAIAAALYERFPQMTEGELSRVRASFVNRDTLARLARDLDLSSALRIGDGEHRSGGATRPSILADALEALFGAIFLDGGFDAARAAIDRVYADEFAAFDPVTFGKDPKTRLQEWLQARRIALPTYEVVNVAGEAHLQSFAVECRVPSHGVVATGTGPSRRVAEQAAAAQAYDLLTGGEPAEKSRDG
jgi:ribonuclease-3